MTVSSGDRVGTYEVTAQLGAGAMGVVWQARDTKLLRNVALKVLPEHFADDPERLSRMEREAQMLAALNHPNIAHVYGLEQAGGSACIVMELVEGETLADRLKKGPLQTDDAIDIARQIAEGLAAAHDRGIVHRDLKPANIKLTSSGAVKILDFGLAKPVAAQPADSSLTMLPTIAGTSVGLIVGTIAYMSPEQARGKEVDPRTDIWAFGCVLYEMLTGRPPFDGETATDIMAKVVTEAPDFDALPPALPPALRLLLAATLNKNVQQRLQHIGDARLLLDRSAVPAGVTAAGAPVPRRATRGLAVAAALLAVAAAALAAALYFRPGPASDLRLLNLHVALPGSVGAPIVSPDGQRIAFIAEATGEGRAIWIRATDADRLQKLSGTDGPQGLAWSPDSRSIAFVADRKLKTIDAAGGSARVLAEASGQFLGLTWARGVVLMAVGGRLVRVSDQGGTVTPVTEMDATRQETVNALPTFLPDGNHFLYAIGSAVPENAGIFVGALDGKTKTRLTGLGTRLAGLAYAPPGYVLVGGESLTAHRFDPSALNVSGTPVAIADAVEGFSVSNNGLLLYRTASTAEAEKQLTWFDRAGQPLGRVGTETNYGNVELSPRGDRLAVDIVTDGNRDVWTIDLARGVSSRITFDPASDWTPVWSPDGTRLAFASSRNGGRHIYEKAASGVGTDALMFKSEATEIPVAWSHDGRHIVFSRFKPAGAPGVDTWLLALSGEQPHASPFIDSPFDKAQAKVSPDGRWIAYTTNDSGLYQVVVQSFPDPNGGKWQITSQGGIEPKWRRDGSELFYLALDGNLMSVPIKPSGPGAFEAGTPAVLFQTPLPVSRTQVPRDRRYDVAPDDRFLIAVPAAAPAVAPVTVVVNWDSALQPK